MTAKAPRERIGRLFAIRESVRDPELMLGKIQHTLTPFALEDPSVNAVLEMGLGPIQFPQRYGATASTENGTLTRILQHDGDVYLYHQGSAASRNADSAHSLDNVYARTLSEAIRMLRPRKVIAADFSRLVRSANYASDLLNTLELHVEELHFDGQTLSPNSPHGRAQFQMLTILADMDRQSIVNRTTLGRIARVERGLFPFREGDLPYGYVKRQGTPTPSADHVSTVRAAIQILGEPDLTVRARAERLADVGFRSCTAFDSGPEGALSFVKHSSASVDRAYRSLTAYQSGVLIKGFKSPTYGAKKILSFDVVTDTEARTSEVQLSVQLGLPENPAIADETGGAQRIGWATDAEFERAFDQMEQQAPRGRRSHGKRYLLSDMPGWHSGGEWRWINQSRDGIYVHSQPADQGPALRSSGVWNTVGFVHRDELLASMSKTIAQGLQDGIEGRQLDSDSEFYDLRSLTRSSEQAAKVSRLRTELSNLRRRATAATNLVVETDDPDLKTELMERAETAFAESRKIQDELVSAEAALPAMRLAEGVDAGLEMLLRGLALFMEANAKVPRNVARAATRVIRQFRLEPTGDGGCVWTCRVAVPADGGVVELGPFSGRVLDHSRRFGDAAVRRASGRPTAAAERVMVEYMTTDVPLVPLMAESIKLSSWGARGLVRHALREAGCGPLGTRAITFEGVPFELRRTVWQEMQGEQPSQDDWVQHIRRVYLETDETWNLYWERPTTVAARFIAAIAQRGGRVAYREALEVVEKGSRRRISDFSRNDSLVTTVATRASSDAGADVLLRRCPHCEDQLTYVRLLPETAFGLATPRALLCTNCRRHPSADGPIFPDFYFG